MYLFVFIWQHQVLVAALGIFLVVRGLLSSCGMRAPKCVGSVVVARELSCPTACGILVPQAGMEPASPALEGRFLTTRPPGKSLLSCLYLNKLIYHIYDYYTKMHMHIFGKKVFFFMYFNHLRGCSTLVIFFFFYFWNKN